MLFRSTKSKYDEDNALSNKLQQTQRTQSLLQLALGKRWSIESLPCETNGGAYETFTHDRGVVFTAGGQVQDGSARKLFEYIDQGEEKFTYKEQWLANDFVARAIGDANAVSAAVEITYTKVNPTKINYKKVILQLGEKALTTGKKEYERIDETGYKKIGRAHV